MSPPTRASGALTGDVGDELIPQRGPPGPPREIYLTHLHPNAGHRGFHERLRRQICVPTRATGALTGDLGDKFVPQRGPPGPPRQTYLTHLCSDAGHQGLHRRLRAHTNIVTPARGVLSRLSEPRFSALRNPEKCPRGVHGDPRRPPRAPEGPSFEPQALQRAQICAQRALRGWPREPRGPRSLMISLRKTWNFKKSPLQRGARDPPPEWTPPQ